MFANEGGQDDKLILCVRSYGEAFVIAKLIAHISGLGFTPGDNDSGGAKFVFE